MNLLFQGLREKGHGEVPEVLPMDTYLLHEVAEKDGLLPQWVMNQPIREEDHALGEVVLGQP